MNTTLFQFSDRDNNENNPKVVVALTIITIYFLNLFNDTFICVVSRTFGNGELRRMREASVFVFSKD